MALRTVSRLASYAAINECSLGNLLPGASFPVTTCSRSWSAIWR
jgi:hypothetical protein